MYRLISSIFISFLFVLNPVFAENKITISAKKVNNQLENDKQSIINVIKSMNRAVTQNNLKAVLATFDNNALKMDLFPAHYPNFGKKLMGQSDKQISLPDYPKTANLRERWQVVFSIMSGRSYERTAKQIDVQVDGAMASAWVKIHTKTISRDAAAKVNNNSFYELLVLKKIQGLWKIMLTSNNRHDR